MTSASDRVIVVGASGQARVVVDLLEQAGELMIAGFIDRDLPVGASFAGYPVLGTDADLVEVCKDHRVRGGVLAVGDNARRCRIVHELQARLPDFLFFNAVHPRASIGRDVDLGCGIRVMAGAVINPGCTVGDYATVDTGASLDHDSILGSYASLAPGAATGGNVRIGPFTAVGIGAAISHGRQVGEHTVVGAGAVVVRDLPSHVVAYGNPARVVRVREAGEPYL